METTLLINGVNICNDIKEYGPLIEEFKDRLRDGSLQTEDEVREAIKEVEDKVRCLAYGYLNEERLGRIAAMRLIKPDYRITAEHGQFVKKGQFMMTAVYHPAALLRDPRKKEDMYRDMKKIKEYLDRK